MTIGSRRRMDRADLFRVIPDYADAASADAAERMFERDKAAILELGLPLATQTDLFDENTVYYRLESAREDAVLDLSNAEYTVLLAASRAWDDAAAGGAARRVRAKLLSLGRDVDPDLLQRTPRGALESLPVLSPLLEAVNAGRAVRFTYRSARGELTERQVEPWIVAVHDGHWYVRGWDRDRGQPRIFRASRLESFPRAAGQAREPRPEIVELSSLLEGSAEAAADPEVDAARLRAEPYKALTLRARAGAPLDADSFTLPDLPRSAARRLLLGEARFLELIEPPAWRAELRAVLEDVARLHEGEADLTALETSTRRPAPSIRVPSSGTDRLSRLISLASYVMARGEVGTEELCAQLGISQEQLISDLQVLFLCGDLGAGFEDLIEAEWEHGVVRVRNAEPLRRGLRLSPVEVTALLAGIAALEPSAGEAQAVLASARAKLQQALPAAPGDADPSGQADQQDQGERPAPRSGTDPSERAGREGPVTGSAQDAAADREEQILHAVHAALRAGSAAEEAPSTEQTLLIRYSSPDGPGTSVRRIRPLAIETDGRRSYLRARCELVGAERSFRLDRIVELPAEGTEQHLAPGVESSPLHGVVEQTVWLRLAPPARWIAEAFEADELRDVPGDAADAVDSAGAAQEGSGTMLARLDRPVAAALVDAIIEASGAAEVLEPRDLRDTIVIVARDAAHRHPSVDALPL